MNDDVSAVIAECTRASDEERITFPQVVGRLMEAGVERYHADLVRNEKIYYMPNGESELTPCHAVGVAPSQDFLASGVDAAVRSIQHGEIKYREFCERIAKAGCVGYVVSMSGRRAVYYGRSGEMHVEIFPGAQ